MAFQENKAQQLSFTDAYNSLTDREKRVLEKSWATDFAENVFPAICEKRFAALYSDNSASRPNTPVNVIIGSLMLKEMFGQTDEELVETILFDVRYQYALRTTSFVEQPVSDRTFSRFRERLYQYEQSTGIDLLKQEMLALAETFRQFLGIEIQLKRMDSLMVASSCKRLSRLDLYYTCVEKLVQTVKHTGHEELLKGFEQYLDERHRNDTLYRCKKEQVEERTAQCMADGVKLEKITRATYLDFSEYQMLKRMLLDHLKEDGQIRDYKELASNALYNPSDPDATTRKKGNQRHIGYVGNFVETLDEHGSMITHYDYRPNIYSDQRFGKDVIEELRPQESPLILIADGGYFGLDLIQNAQDKNIELITTAMMGVKPDPMYAEFALDETGKIIQCAGGQTPKHCTYNEASGCSYAVFDRERCLQCQHREACRVVIRKKSATLSLEKTKIERAQYMKQMSDTSYQKLQNKRNGVEGIPSVLRRRYQVDKMPVRGYLRSKIWFSLKIGAFNVVKFIQWRRKQTLMLAMA